MPEKLNLYLPFTKGHSFRITNHVRFSLLFCTPASQLEEPISGKQTDDFFTKQKPRLIAHLMKSSVLCHRHL